MIVTTLNRRYAKSLLEFAQEQDRVEEVKKDMDYIIEVIEASREMRILLKSPIITGDKKLAIFKEVLGATISEISMTFIKIILTKGREAELEGIAYGFRNIYRQYKGIEEATVTSAHPLTDGQREEIRTKLVGVTGSTIEIQEQVDPSIIGGIKIRVGDKQYNGSIAYQLEQLKRKFQSNQYIADF